MDIDELIRTRIDEKIEKEGQVTIPLLVEDLFKEISVKHSKEWDQWCDARATYILGSYITRLVNTQRNTHRRLRVSEYKTEARQKMEAYAEGDYSIFDDLYTVDDEYTRKPLGDMTAGDHLFVAGKYEKSGKRDLLFAEFHKVVAKKVGDKTTAKAMSEEAFEALQDKILNQQQESA